MPMSLMKSNSEGDFARTSKSSADLEDEDLSRPPRTALRRTSTPITSHMPITRRRSKSADRLVREQRRARCSTHTLSEGDTQCSSDGSVSSSSLSDKLLKRNSSAKVLQDLATSPGSEEALRTYYNWMKFQAVNQYIMTHQRSQKISGAHKNSQLKKARKNIVVYISGSDGSGKSSLAKAFLNAGSSSGSSPKHKKSKKSVNQPGGFEVHVTLNNQPYLFEIRVPPITYSPEEEKSSEFVALRKQGYKGVDVFLMCYPVFLAEDFSNLGSFWLPEIRDVCPDTPFLVVGTKTDLRPGYPGHVAGWFKDLLPDGQVPDFVDFLDAKKRTSDWGSFQYLECSAQTGNCGANGVNAVFGAAARAAEEDAKFNDKCTLCTIM